MKNALTFWKEMTTYRDVVIKRCGSGRKISGGIPATISFVFITALTQPYDINQQQFWVAYFQLLGHSIVAVLNLTRQFFNR